MIVHLTQGTDEWRSFRHDKLGASDFSVIAGNIGLTINYYKKSYNTLIKSKINKEMDEASSYVKDKIFAVGHAFENYIQKDLEVIDLIKGPVYAYDDNNRIIASLDYLDGFVHEPIEIKVSTLDVSDFDMLVDYYKYSLAHQCYVIGAKKANIVIGFFDKKRENLLETLSTEIIAEDVISKDDWLSICNQFLSDLDNYNYIPDNTKSDFEKYFELEAQIKELEKKQKYYGDKLKEKHNNGVCYSEYHIQKVVKKTTSYASFIEDRKIAVPEQYTKISTSLSIKKQRKEKENE